MAEQDIHQTLSRALGADETGNKELAIQYYLETVEAILKIKDPTVRAKLNRFATQSLDRAEQLKGVPKTTPVSSSTTTISSGGSSTFRTVVPVKST